jgi:hypothetical protein
VSRALEKLWMPLLLVGLSAWIALSNTSTGDYYYDAGTAIHPLLHGDLSGYFTAHPLVGPCALLLQVPFAAIGSSQLAEFQWATIPCLLSVAGLGLYLAELARQRGAGRATQILLPMLCLLNPLNFVAIEAGHPEEILTAALAVGALAVASEGHGVRAGLLLGLAIASKQWAVIAIFPTLMALPSRQLRTAILAGLVAAVLMLPGLIAAPNTFFSTQGSAASGGRIASILSGWYAVTPEVAQHLGDTGLTAHVNRMPPWLGPLTHPLVVLLVVALPLALWQRRGRFRISAEQAMALLALLALLRCVLDPHDNLYYHVPLLLALFGWDAVAADRLPLRGLAGSAIALFFLRWSEHLGDLRAFNFAYLTIIVLAAIAIAMQLPWRPSDRASRAAPAPAALWF